MRDELVDDLETQRDEADGRIFLQARHASQTYLHQEPEYRC